MWLGASVESTTQIQHVETNAIDATVVVAGDSRWRWDVFKRPRLRLNLLLFGNLLASVDRAGVRRHHFEQRLHQLVVRLKEPQLCACAMMIAHCHWHTLALGAFIFNEIFAIRIEQTFQLFLCQFCNADIQFFNGWILNLLLNCFCLFRYFYKIYILNIWVFFC